ncbi:MAG: transcriptional repressor NrdR [Chloroflexi bacterium]|nr:transcriptional repressor NrdR [Chloroflexota bacterium]
MRCPYCGHSDSKVNDSRSVDQGIRRRRECLGCGQRFTTYERVDNSILTVIKKDRRREPFDREKLLRGIRKACEKRPLPAGTVEKLIDDIEFELHRTGRSEVSSSKLGEMVMERLLRLDHIAYIRFASVYREFADIGSLKKEVDSLAERESKQLPLITEEL